MNRMKYLDVGGKRFWFNVNQLNRKGEDGVVAHYLKVNSKVGEKEESLTVFPSQFPSVLYKILEAAKEMYELEGLPIPFGVAIHEALETLEEEEETASPEEQGFTCPECGTGVNDPGAKYFTGWFDIRLSGGGETIWVKCGQCGWVPANAHKVNSDGYAIFHVGSNEATEWEERLTWR